MPRSKPLSPRLDPPLDPRRPMGAGNGKRIALGVGWVGILLLLGAYIIGTLRVSGDLRLFLPTPHTRTARLILEEVSAGPASRLLLIALDGASDELLATTSGRLATALRGDPRFRFVANGENLLGSIPQALLPYRYLLSPTLDHERLDASFLHRELIARERDLASPAASVLEPWLPRDPTLEIVKVLESFESPHEPRVLDGVWFNAQGSSALLIVETAAPAFDPRAQRIAIDALRSHFLAARTAPAVRLTVAGPGAFSVLMQNRSEADARLAGYLDTAGMVLLMLLAYRSVSRVVLGTLPLATAGVAALATVTALFGTVNGITIAFGFTLIGVAIDYPIFLFSHQPPGETGIETARSIWPTLATAVAGLSIAYLAFVLSGVMGLVELACFNVAGIASAGLATRYLLPRLLPAGSRDFGRSGLAERLASLADRAPRLGWLAPVVVISSVAALAFVPGPFWQNDLGQLTPVPQPLLARYEALHQELGAPDVRYLLAVEASTADQVLIEEERLRAGLQSLAARAAVSGFEDAARYLPSASVQERRRAALPDAPELRAALDQALRGTAFRPGVFQPFLDDVARARRLAPLTLARLAGTPLELSVGSLLFERSGSWTGLVTFSDVHDPQALERLAASSGGAVRLIDLKQASEDLIAKQRVRILFSIAVAAVLLVAVVYAALRSARRTVRVLTPMALTTLAIVALLHAAGVALNLFHLVSLVLAAGLGLDYGLFFERTLHEESGRRRTLHALSICALAAATVFAVLASSTLPVLRAIGVTVVMGVVGNFALALLMIRSGGTPSHARAR